jgi:micrococcal nuclease
MGRRALLIVLAAVVVALLVVRVGGDRWSAPPPPPPGQAEVVRVVDGDTVVLQLRAGEESVRLIGVDTPETVKPDTPVQCFGPEASAHLHRLLPDGTRVRVARDVEARDHFGRLLLYLWRTEDDRFVNLAILRGGYGRPLAIAPNLAHERQFAGAAAAARQAGRGLWSRCGGG